MLRTALIAVIGLASCSTVPEPAPYVGPSMWMSSIERDAISGHNVVRSCVFSTNTLTLNPPYADQPIEFCFEEHPRRGTRAFLRFPRGGQFNCMDVNLLMASTTCHLAVTYGERQTIGVGATEGADFADNVIVVLVGSAMLPHFRRSEAVAIEIPVYGAGKQVAEFDIRGFRWPPAER